MNQVPAWEITSEYSSLEAKELIVDVEVVKSSITKIHELNLKLSTGPEKVQTLKEIFVLEEKALILLGNVMTYTHCLLSVDAKDEAARKWDSQLEKIHSEFQQATTLAYLEMKRLPEKEFQALCSFKELQGSIFAFEQERKWLPYSLSEKEESLIKSLATSGFAGWSNLYSNLSGTIQCQVDLNGKIETMGLAKAHALTRDENEAVRKAAWHSIQEAWKIHQESAASILNNLAGWRLELVKKRSHTQALHFLDGSLFANRIQRKTLDAMLTAVKERKSEIHKASLLMAKALGKSKMDPWDLLSPGPVSLNKKKSSFADSIQVISDSFSSVSPDMGEFVQMMVDKKWIEARVMPAKTTGAYCTGFAKSLTPRVFMTYMGSNQDTSTLAHELGHAYHSWVMRDLPIAQQEYPSTLAETASIFSETVLREGMIEKAQSKEEKLSYLWGEIEGAVGLLLNIPARYSFEYNFYEKRQKSILSANELSQLMDEAWTEWYGSTLSQNDKLYWAHKLHFSLTYGFYNFPYTFGYLFALSVYARKAELGSQFIEKYKGILRDTGRMTAEDLIQKHLGEDITQVDFWRKSLDVVVEKIQMFEKLI